MKAPLQKLELTWIGKGQEFQLEPRILLEQPELAAGDPLAENMLIHGDNLLALKALEQDFSSKIKCIYIDPPYNTGSAFQHYDDNLENSIWLDLMYQRLRLLKKLLRKDGFICCHIDDSQGQYLKVVMDEVFGRANYLTTLYVRVRYPEKTLKSDMDFHKEIEHIHVYRRDREAQPNLNQEENNFDKFEFYIEELVEGRKTILGGKNATIFEKGEYVIKKGTSSTVGLKEIWATGSILDGNSSGRFFRDYLTGRFEEDGYGVLYKIDGIGDDQFNHRYFTGPNKVGATKGKYFQGVPTNKLVDTKTHNDKPISNFYDLAASFGNCRTEGGVEFRSGKKPEKLLEIILTHFSNPGDWVFDSFLGSGTTAAVAHKMGRRWVGVELGEHARTHCLPRLQKVVSGTDQGGISKAVGWQGGSGFKFYTLAPSLLNKDQYDNWVISKEYNAQMLAAALAKQEGFRYQPDPHIYWKQARSSEHDFLFTTTQFVTVQSIDQLAAQLRPEESLLIACRSYQPACAGHHPRITLKKIPQLLLGRCEFGRDDYSLHIVQVPTTPEAVEEEPSEEAAASTPKQGQLF